MAEFDIDLDVDRTGEARLVAGRKSGQEGLGFQAGLANIIYQKCDSQCG